MWHYLILHYFHDGLVVVALFDAVLLDVTLFNAALFNVDTAHERACSLLIIIVLF